ncbi:hypothetical protein DMH04_13495 [Kibdelosporangium aridum]|uniref:Uncharacterized protein n=1 Tax=Kibdelosporangium aridum TaxID=2030 RepID=A0A428ZFA5_KIBAR|nr:hypothetical protein [Kibdelosporangium aridum]RSM86650.1 hypothetical protein DMH04_13495 [Kibdelosporangium aridum]
MIRSNTPSAFGASVIPVHEIGKLAAEREPGTLAAAIEPLHSAARSYADAQRRLAEALEAEMDG